MGAGLELKALYTPTLSASASLSAPARRPIDDKALVNVVQVDLDVDSDNDDTTDRTQAEDDIEAAGYTGKVVLASNGDADGDEVADSTDMAVDGATYVPMFLELSAGIPSSSDVTLTYDPTVLRVWRTDAADPGRTAGDVVASGSAYPAASLGAAPGGVATLYVEALAGSAALHTIEAAVGVISGSAVAVMTDAVDVAPTVLDLEAAKVQVDVLGNTVAGALPEGAAEDKPGAYVPVNDDDDDYDAANKPDRDQPGAVTGEDDLLPVTVKKFEGAVAAGSQRLYLNGVKAFRNSDRTEPVTSATDLPLGQDTQLYIEGSEVGAKRLRLVYVNDKGQPQPQQVGGDTLKLNVFKWTGPLNVPEHGIYKYTAGPTNLPAGAKWVEPSNGAIHEVENPKSVRIKWEGTGIGLGATGRAILEVDENYTWALNLNVVEVEVEAPDVGQAFKAGTPEDNAQVGKVKPIFSGDPVNDPGLTSQAKVTLHGPDGRGVKEMRVGFSQNVILSRLRVKYDDIDELRVSSLEGDAVRLDGNPEGDKPYYDSENPASVFFDPTAVNNSKTLIAEDTPSAGIPVFYNKNNQAQNLLDAVDLQYDWELYIIASTTDTRNDANDVYVREAEATGGWHWTVNQNLGAAPNYAFTPNAASTITPPTGWTKLTDGSEQDEKEAWALPAYQDPTHWLG